MNLKFLPLGSMCTIDDSNLKLVVVGYKINEYDYVAVEYPVGYESVESLRYFNHNQISDLYSYGYKDEVGKNYFVALNEIKSSDFEYDKEERNEIVDENPGFYFDDNGVVVVDTTVPEIIEDIPSINVYGDEFDEENEKDAVDVEILEETTPAFSFDENGVVVEDKTAPVAIEESSTFKFDENGVVIEDATAPVVVEESSAFKFDENGVVIEDATAPVVTEESSTFKFDENGVVIEDKTAPVVVEEPLKPQPLYKFDENGIVIEDTTAPLIPSVSNFQFDENGVVIADATAPTLTETTEGVSEETENQSTMDEVKFNEDGTVSLDEDANSIFSDIEAPGVIGESKEEIVFDTDMAALEIPTKEKIVEAPVSEIVSGEEKTLEPVTELEANPVVEEKKEEKKKRGFFSFGK